MAKEKGFIKKVYKNSESVAKPTLLNFQNGSLSMVDKDRTRFYPVLNKKKNTKGAVVVSNKSVYHGVIQKQGLAEELTDFYICVKNRSNNNVRIIPIEQVQLNNEIYSKLAKSSIQRFSKDTSKLKLIQQFGGRNALRSIDRTEKMKMSIDIIKNELDTTLNNVSFSDIKDKINADENMDLLRPKFNKDALKLHEVYKVHDLVPQELLDRLEEEAEVVFKTKSADLPISSDFLKKHIEKIQDGPLSMDAKLHIKIIIYMDGLMNLMKTRIRLLGKVELSKITEKVENDIRARFSDPNGPKSNYRTLFSNEKALCYFIVLALIISDNYSVDINILAQEVKMPKVKISRFAQVVNAKKKFNSDLLLLKLPSQIAPIQAKARRQTANKTM